MPTWVASPEDEYYCSNFDEDNECCVYDTLAREVGIEVDE